MTARCLLGSGIGLLLIGSQTAFAQLAVQQPVVGITSINTTVSVPDRGSAYLGGFGRAAYHRAHFGPFRSGTALGIEHENSGMSAHSRTHDLSEMDRILSARMAAEPPLRNQHAEHAWAQLSRGAAAGGPASATKAAPIIRRPAALMTGLPPDRPRERQLSPGVGTGEAERQYQLGLKAEQDGRPGLARLHYRAAVRYGSTDAGARLAALEERQPGGSGIARVTD